MEQVVYQGQKIGEIKDNCYITFRNETHMFRIFNKINRI